ncbi:MAG: PD-(D/E)XK nuclease family transposase [Lachnospiraceae bacterium]|nr:PD-(D/E)XK nuclease family transposase [Lachnospiraceae bacterium]
MKSQQKIVEKLRPIDDILFQKMAEDKSFCAEVISTIMEEQIEVIETIPQNSIKNLQGRSVILDALCRDEGGRTFNVEVQKENNDNHQKRVRYNASCITANISEPGIKFEKVPDVCVIYISEFDLFNKECAVYHIDRVLRENGAILENGFTEIYVNAKASDGSDVSKLMKLFTDTDSYDYEHFPYTSGRKHQFKETEKGVNIMCKELEEYVAESNKRAAKEAAKENAKVMLQDNVPVEKIKMYTGLSIEVIMDLRKSK